MEYTQICLTPIQAIEYLQLKYHLPYILADLANWWPLGRIYITDMFRPDGGVHEYFRGIDVGVKNLGADFQPIIDGLGDKVNEKWVYDPQRPDKKVAVTEPHGTGPHIHLQSHPRTGLRST